MLEIKITVHMSKEGDNHFGLSITDRNFSVYVRDTNFCVCLEGKKENPSKLSITDTDFCVYVSPDLLIHTFSFTFSWNLLIVFEFSGSLQFSSVAQSCLTLQLHESHHAQPRCPSPTPGIYSNSCPLSWWCHPAISSSVVPFSSCSQSLPASVFSSESTLHMRWPKYWCFSFSISPSKEHPGRISFRMDWLDLLAVQGTLKSLLQHHSSKASILRRSVFFTVQLLHPYMTTGKTIALTRQTFVGKVMSLLLNMLSRLVIIFLPRSRHLLISWLQSPSAVVLEPKKIKSDTVSTVSPSVSHEVMGPDAIIFVFWTLGCKPTFSLSSFTFIKRLFSS